MRSLDHDYVNELVKRLQSIPVDAKPNWGVMTPAQLITHLASVVRYSMGRTRPVPVRGGWAARKVFAPLILNGLMRLPKNVKLPKAAQASSLPATDLETLQALLEEYLQLVQADELSPPPHPFFGDLGVDGWAKMHVVHFEHHLRQFKA